MIIVFLRAIILFIVLLVVIRLMGKRQIGEMEPFELVITLIIAELACIPMADRSIPISFGVVAMLSIFVVHQFIVLLLRNEKLQQVISGKPVMVIDKQGINTSALAKMNMQVMDLLQSVRTAGYFSIEEISYGLMETNGQLSVVPNKEFSATQTLPVSIIVEGKWNEGDVEGYKIDKQKVLDFLQKHRIRYKNVILLTIDGNNHCLLQAKGKHYFTCDIEGERWINE